MQTCPAESMTRRGLMLGMQCPLNGAGEDRPGAMHEPVEPFDRLHKSAAQEPLAQLLRLCVECLSCPFFSKTCPHACIEHTDRRCVQDTPNTSPMQETDLVDLHVARGCDRLKLSIAHCPHHSLIHSLSPVTKGILRRLILAPTSACLAQLDAPSACCRCLMPLHNVNEHACTNIRRAGYQRLGQTQKGPTSNREPSSCRYFTDHVSRLCASVDSSPVFRSLSRMIASIAQGTGLL